MATKIVYATNAAGIYTGLVHAYTTPLEPDVWQGLPEHYSDTAPPECGPREWPKLVGGAWLLVPDWRGIHLFNTESGAACGIHDPGVLPADIGATDVPPPDPHHVWQAGAWVLDAARVAAAAKAEMDAAVAAGIAEAVRQLAVLQDAVDLGIATPAETEAHTAWRRYRVLLSRVPTDSSYPKITLPVQPEKVIQ